MTRGDGEPPIPDKEVSLNTYIAIETPDGDLKLNAPEAAALLVSLQEFFGVEDQPAGTVTKINAREVVKFGYWSAPDGAWISRRVAVLTIKQGADSLLLVGRELNRGPVEWLEPPIKSYKLTETSLAGLKGDGVWVEDETDVS